MPGSLAKIALYIGPISRELLRKNSTLTPTPPLLLRETPESLEQRNIRSTVFNIKHSFPKVNEHSTSESSLSKTLNPLEGVAKIF
jgi:hypothetical protein